MLWCEIIILMATMFYTRICSFEYGSLLKKVIKIFDNIIDKGLKYVLKCFVRLLSMKCVEYHTTLNSKLDRHRYS